jgi:site-specific recombinase XerD
MDIHYRVRQELLRRGNSPRTAETYLNCIDQFFKKCNKDISKISKIDVREFLNNMAEKKAAGNTLNVYLNALKFLFEEILHKNMRLNIKYSKKPKTLPVVLTQREVKQLIDAVKNPGHKLMVELMYSAGLRVSELVNLKAKDLELDNWHGWVRHGKGNKDRAFVIARKIKDRLAKKVSKLEQEDYLFSGNEGHISQRTIQEIIKDATKKASIKKKVHCHTLRHSFATHLIENGNSVSSVQSLLGHNNVNTTMVYVHLATNRLIDVESPLDKL